VVVTYLGLQQPKKSRELVIYGLLSLNIVLKRLRSVTLDRCSCCPLVMEGSKDQGRKGEMQTAQKTQ
jgi:hypothetical protein